MPIKNWKLGENGIYQTDMDQGVWQLTVNGQLANVARWPDASFEEDALFVRERVMRYTDSNFDHKKRVHLSVTRAGIIKDMNWPLNKTGYRQTDESGFSVKEEALLRKQVSLAESGIDFTGAIGILNSGHWVTYGREILTHGSGNDTFTYNPEGIQVRKHVGYSMIGMQALDKGDEWWYDKNSKGLYYKPTEGANPNDQDIRGQVNDIALLVHKSKNIQIRGITVRTGAPFVEKTEGLLIEDCNFLYSASHKFMLGEFAWNNSPNLKKQEQGNIWVAFLCEGDFRKNMIRNCEFSYINTPLMLSTVTFRNNYVHHTEWDLNSSAAAGTIMSGNGKPFVFEYNTVHTGGNSEGIRPLCGGSIVSYNNVYNLGLLQYDGSAINLFGKAITGSIVSNNWAHNTDKQGIRFDALMGYQRKNYPGMEKDHSWYGVGGTIHHNVIWNSKPNQIKGESHLVHNNSVFNILSKKSHMTIFSGDENFAGFNYKTVVRNNIAFLAKHMLKNNPDNYVLNGVADHNLGEINQALVELRGPLYGDFRPKKNGPLVDGGAILVEDEFGHEAISFNQIQYVGKAPDIGAYEVGDKKYWIPGARLKQSSTPIPFNDSTEVDVEADVMWLGAYKATKHMVYFGKDESVVSLADHNTESCVGEFTDGNIYEPGLLEPGVTYFWRVDAEVDGEVRKGTVWNFKTTK